MGKNVPYPPSPHNSDIPNPLEMNLPMTNQAPVKNERMLLIVLAGMLFTHLLDFMVMAPLGPQLIRLLHIDTQQFVWLMSSYTFAAALSGLLSTTYIDRFDRRKLMPVTFALFTLATLLCGFAQGFFSFLVARALAGAFGGMISSMAYHGRRLDSIRKARRRVGRHDVLVFGGDCGRRAAGPVFGRQHPLTRMAGTVLLYRHPERYFRHPWSYMVAKRNSAFGPQKNRKQFSASFGGSQRTEPHHRVRLHVVPDAGRVHCVALMPPCT